MSTPAARRAVVTGAAGFLGRAFATALREQGWHVTGVDVQPGPGVRAGDVTRPDGFADALDGAALVVHTAARVAEHGRPEAFRRTNVDGTVALLRAAEAAGVRRFLHLSSIVVLGRDFPDGAGEDEPVRPTGNPYTDTKIAAEHAALRVAASGRLAVTVVRPGDVYGPGSVPWTLRPVQMLRAGQLALLDGGRGVLSPVYVDDVVAGALAAAGSDAGVGEVFHLTGGVGVGTAEFFGHYARLTGRRLRSVPAPLVRAALRPLDLVERAGRTPPLSSRTLEYLTHPGTYSIAKAERLLGWTPAVDLDDGMRRTAAWLRAQGLLD
jgi:2-alkyl-3-oxoalkanoate reductase